MFVRGDNICGHSSYREFPRLVLWQPPLDNTTEQRPGNLGILLSCASAEPNTLTLRMTQLRVLQWLPPVPCAAGTTELWPSSWGTQAGLEQDMCELCYPQPPVIAIQTLPARWGSSYPPPLLKDFSSSLFSRKKLWRVVIQIFWVWVSGYGYFINNKYFLILRDNWKWS